MLAGLNSHWDLVLTYQIVSQADVIEIIHFDHHMIESLVGSSYAKRDCVIALIAVHEDQLEYSLSHVDLVFDSAAHSQLSIETLRRGEVLFTNDAVAESACAGLEAPMHRPARMERFAELNLWPMEYLDRVAARIVQFEDFEHPALLGFFSRADLKFYSRGGELSLHRGKFLGARDSKTQVRKIIAAVCVQCDSMMRIVHPQIATVRFAFVDEFH